MKKIILLLTVCFYFLQLSYAQPGSLDPSFGANGIVKTSLGVNYNYGGNARKVLAQPDGSIFIITDRGENLSAILKFHPDGTPDLSYGNQGSSVLVTITVTSGAMQTDGKIIIAGGSGIYFTLARFNLDGSLDNKFGVNGIQKTSFGDDYAYVTSLAIGNDGKIVALGNSIYHYDLVYTEIAMARYTPDGTLDNTFNGNGKFLKSYGGFDNAESVAIQADGKIIISVVSDFGQVNRFNTDGSLDNTFSLFYVAGPVAIQSDGKILIGNSRFNINGAFDASFETDFSIRDIIIQTDGKIIAAGYNDSNFVIARYTSALKPDNTFSGDGKQITKFAGTLSAANSAAIQNDGKILDAGFSYTDKIQGLAVARYTIGGNLDNSFDGDGKLTAKLVDANTIYTCTSLAKDGKLVAAGKAWNGRNFDFALARYNVNGSLDNTFSGDGKQLTDFNAQNDYLNSIAIQSDGKIVVTGSTGDDPSKSFIIVRYNIDGTLDKGFSDDGIQFNAYGIRSVALQSDGKIVVGGQANIWPYSFALSRFNPNGSPDNGFGENGTVIITDYFDHQFNSSFVNSIAIQKDGKIVAAGGGYDDNYPGIYDLLIIRYNANGSIDNTFSNYGIVATDHDNGNHRNLIGNAVSIQSDGTIVVACNSTKNGSNAQLYAYNTNGVFLKSLVLPFNNDFGDYVTSIAVESNDKIVTAGKSSANFTVARITKDFSLDNTFSGDGIRVVNVSPGNDGINRISISGNKLYAAGSGQYPGFYGVVARYILDDNTQNQPPLVSLTTPDNNTVYAAPATIYLKALASDKDGSVAKVQFYNGAVLLHTEYVAPYGFLLKDLPVGTYTLTAKATDNSGLSSTSASVHVSVIVSSTPMVSITIPAENSTFTAPASIKINATATDPAGISKVEFYNGTKLLHTEHLAPYGFLFSNVPAGKYTLTVKATNNNGVAVTAIVHVTVINNNTIAMVQDINKSIVDLSNESLSLKLSPNPVQNTLNISINGKLNKPAELYLLSASGLVLKNIHSLASNQLPLNVSSLANGVYVIKVISGDKVMYKQFVKM